jgi:hypothetical protein
MPGGRQQAVGLAFSLKAEIMAMRSVAASMRTPWAAIQWR